MCAIISMLISWYGLIIELKPPNHDEEGDDNEGDNEEEIAEVERYMATSERDEEYLSILVDLIEDAATVFKARFDGAWNVLRTPIVQLMLMDGSNHPELKRTGLEMFVDIVAQLPVNSDSVTFVLPTVVPVLIACLSYDMDLDSAHRQAASYGLGICAQQCGTAMIPYIDGT